MSQGPFQPKWFQKTLKLYISLHKSSLIFLYVKMLLTSGLFEHSLTPDVIKLFSAFDTHH